MNVQIILLSALGIVLSIFSTFMLYRINNKIETQSKNNNFWMKIYPVVVVIVQISIVIIKKYLYMEENLFDYIRDMTLVSLLSAAAVTDAKFMKIPNSIVICGLLEGFVITLLEIFFLPDQWLSNLFGEGIAIVGLVILIGICLLVMKNSIGMGDIKILIVMAYLLGLPDILTAIFVSLFVSFLVSIVLLLSKNKTRSDSIPFAPFMFAGTVIAIIANGV